MSWHHCDHEIADTDPCPECGLTKEQWTVEFEATREFQVRRRGLRLELLDREGEPIAEEAFQVKDAQGTLLHEGELDELGRGVWNGQIPQEVTVRFSERQHGEVRRADAEGEDTGEDGQPDYGERGDFLCSPGPRCRFRTCGRVAHMLEVEDVLFHHDSAVLLPEGPTSDGTSTADQERRSGIAALAAVLRFARDNPQKRLLVSGHADTSGEEDRNETLAARRAQLVEATLRGNRRRWVALAHARHQAEDGSAYLDWLASTRGWDCGPAASDRWAGFRAGYREAHDRAAGSGQGPTEADWGAFFDCLQEDLADHLDCAVSELAGYRDALRFLDPPAVGCGESWPLEAVGIDDHRAAANRRVELLFFDEGEAPRLDCHRDGVDVFQCELYDPDHGARYRVRHLELPGSTRVDLQEGVYARFRMPARYQQESRLTRLDAANLNLFNTTDRVTFRERLAAMAGEDGSADPQATEARSRLQGLDLFIQLQDGVTAPHGSPPILIPGPGDDLLIPLRATLVVPDPRPSSAPLVLLCHGRDGLGWFDGSGQQRVQESLDHHGYGYLQDELAAHGIASLAVDVNVVDDFEFTQGYAVQSGDYAMRAQILLLWLLLLRKLAGAELSLTDSNSPLFVVGPGGGSPTPLPSALDGSLPDDLCDLREAAACLSFASLGLLGHSRGGSAILSCFASMPGRDQQLPLHSRHDELHATNRGLSELAGLDQSAVRCLVPFEPAGLTLDRGIYLQLDAPHTLVLVVAGTHDMDVRPWSVAKGYCFAQFACPHAFLMIGRATHVRFNSVWRGTQPAINKLRLAEETCRQRLLSAAEHEAACRFYVGGAFRAALGGEQHLLGRLSGAVPAPTHLTAHMIHCLSSSPTTLDRVLIVPGDQASQPTMVSRQRPNLHQGTVSYATFETHNVRLEASSTSSRRLRIPLSGGLTAQTRFAFELAKYVDLSNSAEIARQQIRGFTLWLMSNQTPLASIDGDQFPSLRSIVPASLPRNGTGPCTASTCDVLQTVELPLGDFGPELARATAVEIECHSTPGRSEPEVFVFSRFRLVPPT